MRQLAWLVPLLFSACVATDLPRLTTLSNPGIAYRVADKPYHVLERGPVRIVIVDNQAVDDEVLPAHAAGYNGVASLTHVQQRRNIFVPTYAGLNFEHIHDGTMREPRGKLLFEPRHVDMELRIIDEYTVELYQPPTPYWGLESVHRFHLLEDGTIELTFECIPRRDSYRGRYIGLFWASYINQPESLDIFFPGWNEGGDAATPPRWIRGTSPDHGKLATHRARDDDRDFSHESDFPLSLVTGMSTHRYAQPWYFGVSHGMALVKIFRPQDEIRLTQSPRGAGPGNPAWDFQHFIKNYRIGRRYQIVMRACYLPYESKEQIERDTEAHRRALGH